MSGTRQALLYGVEYSDRYRRSTCDGREEFIVVLNESLFSLIVTLLEAAESCSLLPLETRGVACADLL